MKQEMLYRYLYGQTSEEENTEILAWLDADPQNHIAELNEIQYALTAIDQFAGPAQQAGAAKSRPLRRFFIYAASAAASICVLLGAWMLGGQYSIDSLSDRLAVVEVPAGQPIKITLEDGTRVTLNAGSKLEYPPIFEKKVRNVKLSGEALFEVQPAANRPFVVETFASKIEVLGTTFNVFADSRMNRFSTVLVEGSIKVSSLLDSSESIIMEPYDVVNLIDTHLYKTQTSDFSDLCWTEGLISLKNTSFTELMSKFEKTYDVKISYNCKTLPELNVMSGEIRVSDGIENALHILQQVSDFTYERDGKTNVIVIK